MLLEVQSACCIWKTIRDVLPGVKNGELYLQMVEETDGGRIDYIYRFERVRYLYLTLLCIG